MDNTPEDILVATAVAVVAAVVDWAKPVALPLLVVVVVVEDSGIQLTLTTTQHRPMERRVLSARSVDVSSFHRCRFRAVEEDSTVQQT